MGQAANFKAAGQFLKTLWDEGHRTDHLPEELRPVSRADGYAIQSGLEDASDHPLVGWKIAATSKAGQEHINVDGPLAGRILKETLAEDGATLSLAGNNMRVVELEFAFRLGRDLPAREGRYSDAEVRDAVDGLLPALEVPSSRYEDFCVVGAPALIADNSCAHQFLFGDEIDPALWRDADLRKQEVTAYVTDKGSFHGIGANVLGDPWVALTWLVNECSEHGVDVKADQVVSTGTCLVPVPVEEGDELVADFGIGGAKLTLRFA